MKITLVRGDERAEIEGDDELITNSICYQSSFERRCAHVEKLFYGCAKEQAVQGPRE